MYEALDALYAEVPDAGCRGLCQEACGPLPMTVLEAKRLRRSGQAIPHEDVAMERYRMDGHYACPALEDGRCSAYAERPLVCRLYGSTDTQLLRCPHGCAPETSLTRAEASSLLERVIAAGGGLR